MRFSRITLAAQPAALILPISHPFLLGLIGSGPETPCDSQCYSSTESIQETFPFYSHLRDFYVQNRRRIRQHYHELSRKYLYFNSTENANAFLRQPQFEALEM